MRLLELLIEATDDVTGSHMAARRRTPPRARRSTRPMLLACSVALVALTATSGATTPVGELDGMPRGDLPGWRQVFSDDFDGTALNTERWGRYTGRPGSDPGSQWAASHVIVGGGVMTLSTYRDPAYGNAWTSGGINNARSVALRAGKYEIRMRADRARGINAVALLWPTDNRWPPEIDFVEDRDGDREDYAATLHYRGSDGKHRQIHRPPRHVDMRDWHTYGVEWGAGRVVYTFDGKPWATVETRHVPDVRMGLAIQSNAVTRGAVQPDSTTPAVSAVQVDWVVGYAPAY